LGDLRIFGKIRCKGGRVGHEGEIFKHEERRETSARQQEEKMTTKMTARLGLRCT